MLKEFKEFALKGNLIDMAVAFVMGAAFTKFSTSFIDDLFMPFVAKLMGGADYSNKFIPLYSEAFVLVDGKKEAVVMESLKTLADAKKYGPVFAYGNFITIGLNFVIVAFVMFLVVKAINKLKKAKDAEVAAAPVAPSAQEVLLTEIRDLLKK
jgi:large conductance mechanosensitive channel